ncbi:MAG: phosphoribosylglycinamide formyltransferase [Flavobacteriia bacterium]|nr:phosphoribosylglycinamide formyltransferase [Flavobacteriia bacterium]
MKKNNLAVFASGSGSNTVNIIQYFQENEFIEIKLVVCNKWDAPVIQKAVKLGVSVFICTNDELDKKDFISNIMEEYSIQGIVLAGFLRKIPSDLIQKFPQKIINIHPALLPKYGGKGMYGMFVHRAIIQNKEKHSGITIHIVDEKYDNGETLFQEKVEITAEDNPESLQHKIHLLEMEFFPQIIEKHFSNNENN